MSENKFIRHLQGKGTAKSVLEIRNQNTPTSFANMPQGTSNANDVYSDHRGDAAGVLKGTENWKLDGQNLVETAVIYGDGRDFTNTTYDASGNNLWVDATCVFSTSRRFAPNTKFVLKLCGHDLETVVNSTIDFTLVVKIGNAVISKMFTVAEQAFSFCKDFEIDFGESNADIIKVAPGDSMQVQLLCADANAQATIYNGMTVFTALQRRVDAETVASDNKTFAEVVQDIDDINEEIGDIHEDIDNLEDYVDDTFVRLDGNSIMTGPLKMRASSSFQCAIAPYWDGVGFFKLNSDNSVTLIASIDTPDGFVPWVTNTYNIGSSSKKWKNLYLAGKAFVATINNGADLVVPNKAGTLATMDDVELAARSGRMLTDQGVWYAKMYAATVAPAAEDGTNYADFSQVDGQGNPIIVTYTRVNGAWVQDQTITPPAEYDGYVPITSKIWDIAEQAGQQGGRILWNHQSKEFTPYPQIISFKDIEITGNSTVVMPQAPSSNQIVNKDYIDNAIGNGTITITQSGIAKGSFTTNQSTDTTIDIEVGGTGRNIGDTFLTTRTDNELNGAVECNGATYNTTDFTGAQSIGELLAAGKVPYVSLSVYAVTIASQGWCDAFGWDGVGTTAFRVPTIDLRHQIVETQEPTEDNDYTWYRWYANDWIEQGGITESSSGSTAKNVVFPIEMADTNYTALVTIYSDLPFGSPGNNPGVQNTNSTTGMTIYSGNTGALYWEVKGMTVPTPHTNRRVMVQLAVSATDEAVATCTGVLADVAANTAAIAEADYVIESQLPTASNNYTWYRKYKSGWVEQGQYKLEITKNQANIVTLPVPMADTSFGGIISCANTTYGSATTLSIDSRSTTQVNLWGYTSASASNIRVSWEVKGMAQG